MIKVVAIMGKAGAGKDALLHKIFEKYRNEFHEIVSCTTRPPREGEVDGVNYHFLTHEQFSDQLLDGEMLEATVFNDWCYGTSVRDLDENKVNIGVYNPQGVSSLLDMEGALDILPVLVECSPKVRLMRQLTRESEPNVDEIVRRYLADNEDFGHNDRNVFDKIDLPGDHLAVVLNNDDGASLDELADAVVTNIRHWAEYENLF